MGLSERSKRRPKETRDALNAVAKRAQGTTTARRRARLVLHVQPLTDADCEQLSAEAADFKRRIHAAGGSWSLTVSNTRQILLTGRPEAARRHIAAFLTQLRGSHGFTSDELRAALEAEAVRCG